MKAARIQIKGNKTTWDWHLITNTEWNGDHPFPISCQRNFNISLEKKSLAWFHGCKKKQNNNNKKKQTTTTKNNNKKTKQNKQKQNKKQKTKKTPQKLKGNKKQKTKTKQKQQPINVL